MSINSKEKRKRLKAGVCFFEDDCAQHSALLRKVMQKHYQVSRNPFSSYVTWYSAILESKMQKLLINIAVLGAKVTSLLGLSPRIPQSKMYLTA